MASNFDLPGTPEKLAYSIREAADALGISPEKVRRLIKAGRLKSVMLDGRRLIHRDHLIEFADRLKARAS